MIFFSDFLHEVRSPYHFDDQYKKFGSKKFFDPPGGFLYPKKTFLAKKWTFEPKSSKRRYNFFLIFDMETTLMVSFEKIIVSMPGKF